MVFWAVTASSVPGMFEGFRGTCYPIIWVSKYAGSHFILDDSSHILGCILMTRAQWSKWKKVVINFVTFLCFGWCSGDIKRRSCHLYTYLHGRHLLSYLWLLLHSCVCYSQPTYQKLQEWWVWWCVKVQKTLLSTFKSMSA